MTAPTRIGLLLGGWALSVVSHEIVQSALRVGSVRLGAARFEMLEVAVGVPVVIGPLLVSGVRAARRYGGRAVAWPAWLALAGLGWEVYGQTVAEVAHFLQYGLVVWFLGGRPTVAMSVALGLGVLDEAWQGAVLYPRLGMDWNDVILDAFGAALGALARWTWR